MPGSRDNYHHHGRHDTDTWHGTLHNRYDSAVSLFNFWVGRRKSPMRILDSAVLALASESLSRMHEEPDWQLGLETSPYFTKLLQIYEGVLVTYDILRITETIVFSVLSGTDSGVGKGGYATMSGGDFRRFLTKKKPKKRNVRKDDEEEVPADSRIIIGKDFSALLDSNNDSGLQKGASSKKKKRNFIPVGFGNRSLWNLKMSVDEACKALLVRAKQSDEAEPVTKVSMEQIEVESMVAEDARSVQMNYEYEAALVQRLLVVHMSTLKQQIDKESGRIRMVSVKLEAGHQEIQKRLKFLDTILDSYLVNRALAMYEYARDNIRLGVDDTFSIQQLKEPEEGGDRLGHEDGEARMKLVSNLEETSVSARYYSIDIARALERDEGDGNNGHSSVHSIEEQMASTSEASRLSELALYAVDTSPLRGMFIVDEETALFHSFTSNILDVINLQSVEDLMNAGVDEWAEMTLRGDTVPSTGSKLYPRPIE
eukprot:gene4711-5987_t